MTITHNIQLIDGSGAPVDALLLEQIDPQYTGVAESLWLTYIALQNASLVAAGQPIPTLDHDHWKWTQKVTKTYNLLPTPTFAIQCNGDTQGMMMLETALHQCRLAGQKSSPLVYVDLLASAPWNLGVYEPTRHRGIGTLLLQAAIQTSLDLGFKGRIGLHSLPGADDFYEKKCNMACDGHDANKHGLKYYEMTPTLATAFMP